MSVELLSAPIRKYIRAKGWQQLRPIQNAAIAKIIGTQNHCILASRTASGKTEAAFLPILSTVDFQENGVQVLYVAPLIALINDQFFRVEELCTYLDVSITKWHGEANTASKHQLIKHPSGIVLITPESLEALFVNKPQLLQSIFSNLKFVVVDEIHSFLGSDRGTQLKSLLSRLQKNSSSPFRIVGLSATIGDFNQAKSFTGNPENTKVLIDRTTKETDVCFKFFSKPSVELPMDLMCDLYQETKNHKVLIFPNNRGLAEEVAVGLMKLAEQEQGHSNYFTHHSSIDRDLREEVECFAKTNTKSNFCIACTSTLELGIDIGTVDSVVQIDASSSIASLIQRLGRSARQDGARSQLFLYATNGWSLLQSLACWILFKQGFIEPADHKSKPYDILLHQALSIVKGNSGMPRSLLVQELSNNPAFLGIETCEIEDVLQHLIQIDFLEAIQHEMIIGTEGEKRVNSQEFYSVFKTEENYQVKHDGLTIGAIPLSPQICANENIFLSAKIWKIKYVDFQLKKIEVVPAADGKRPTFFGSGQTVNGKIREKMFEIVVGKEEFDFLDNSCRIQLKRMRQVFSSFIDAPMDTERPLIRHGKNWRLYTFSGTRVNRTIHFIAISLGFKNTLDEQSSCIEFEPMGSNFYFIWNALVLADVEMHVSTVLETRPKLLDFSKWGMHLPKKYKVKLAKEVYFDVNQTKMFLNNTRPTFSIG